MLNCVHSGATYLTSMLPHPIGMTVVVRPVLVLDMKEQDLGGGAGKKGALVFSVFGW